MRDVTEVREMMLFDYMEGNLSTAEIAEMEKDMLLDPSLREELDAWQKTYINTDDVDTSNLEALIIKSAPPRYSILSYLNLFLLFSFVFISGHQFRSNEKSVVSKPVSLQIKNAQDVSLTYMYSKKATNTNTGAKNALPMKIPNYKEWKSNDTAMIEDFTGTDGFVLSIESISPRQLDDYKLIPLTITRLKTSSRSSAYKMSRKQIRHRERQTSRYKAKELERRQAAKFMKGNEPYVVPIDMKRF